MQNDIAEAGLKLPKRCPNCRAERREVKVTKECVDCGTVFHITKNEAKYYAERGFTEPKRCPECREKRRNGGKNGPKNKKQEQS